MNTNAHLRLAVTLLIAIFAVWTHIAIATEHALRDCGQPAAHRGYAFAAPRAYLRAESDRPTLTPPPAAALPPAPGSKKSICQFAAKIVVSNSQSSGTNELEPVSRCA
jgi:hypothetical protein